MWGAHSMKHDREAHDNQPLTHKDEGGGTLEEEPAKDEGSVSAPRTADKAAFNTSMQAKLIL